jgi:tRNA threonylcarbamoyladenosine biosynthesis protein TsaB
MIVLGINTSRRVGSVALTNDQEMLGELGLEMEYDCLRNILAMIDYLLTQIHLTIGDVDLITVVLGPGSWSALRIGVATAKSLAHVCNKPIVGVNTLDVLAHNLRYTEKLIYPVISAKKGYVYYAGYDCANHSPQRVTEYRFVTCDALFGDLRAPAVVLLDDGLRDHAMAVLQSNQAITLGTPALSQIRPSFVNEAGLHKFANSGADDTFSLAAVYLPDAEAESKPTLVT